MSTQSTTEKRKVARIVFDRPPLKTWTFVLFLLAGAVLGFLVALLIGWLYYGLGKPEGFLTQRECWEWYFVLPLLGLLGGAAIGFGYKREVSAHIEMVEQPSMSRRRSSSTAMVRVDYGRRW